MSLMTPTIVDNSSIFSAHLYNSTLASVLLWGPPAQTGPVFHPPLISHLISFPWSIGLRSGVDYT